jgi:hypothetical protein
MPLFKLSVVDRPLWIECVCENLAHSIEGIYAKLKHESKTPHITYRITHDTLAITRQGSTPELLSLTNDHLYWLDQSIVIGAQKLRPELYFVHAAVLAFDGKAIALVAPSGSGKSTTAWGLLHHGFRYLSDELAPIDVTSLRVHAFPRALCLKQRPPCSYPLFPNAAHATERTYVPISVLAGDQRTQSWPLEHIFFLRFLGKDRSPRLGSINAADATVRLYTNVLNPLAHPASGLDAALELVLRTQCHELLSGDLRATCKLVTAFLGLEPAKNAVSCATQ